MDMWDHKNPALAYEFIQLNHPFYSTAEITTMTGDICTNTLIPELKQNHAYFPLQLNRPREWYLDCRFGCNYSLPKGKKKGVSDGIGLQRYIL